MSNSSQPTDTFSVSRPFFVKTGSDPAVTLSPLTDVVFLLIISSMTAQLWLVLDV